MDFRMDKSSWGMLVVMMASFMYFVLQNAVDVNFVNILKAFGLSLLVLIALLAVMSIPVLIYCYFVKKIPDIDYSIRASFAFTIIGIITELI